VIDLVHCNIEGWLTQGKKDEITINTLLQFEILILFKATKVKAMVLETVSWE
jgi:hypothetical protein